MVVSMAPMQLSVHRSDSGFIVDIKIPDHLSSQ